MLLSVLYSIIYKFNNIMTGLISNLKIAAEKGQQIREYRCNASQLSEEKTWKIHSFSEKHPCLLRHTQVTHVRYTKK